MTPIVVLGEAGLALSLRWRLLKTPGTPKLAPASRSFRAVRRRSECGQPPCSAAAALACSPSCIRLRISMIQPWHCWGWPSAWLPARRPYLDIASAGLGRWVAAASGRGSGGDARGRQVRTVGDEPLVGAAGRSRRGASRPRSRASLPTLRITSRTRRPTAHRTGVRSSANQASSASLCLPSGPRHGAK